LYWGEMVRDASCGGFMFCIDVSGVELLSLVVVVYECLGDWAMRPQMWRWYRVSAFDIDAIAMLSPSLVIFVAKVCVSSRICLSIGIFECSH